MVTQIKTVQDTSFQMIELMTNTRYVSVSLILFLKLTALMPSHTSVFVNKTEFAEGETWLISRRLQQPKTPYDAPLSPEYFLSASATGIFPHPHPQPPALLLFPRPPPGLCRFLSPLLLRGMPFILVSTSTPGPDKDKAPCLAKQTFFQLEDPSSSGNGR